MDSARSLPPLSVFTPDERRVIRKLSTPSHVQTFLNDLPYNDESSGETLRSFRGVLRHGTVHCLEAALFAAVVLEQHGFPPLVLSFESIDKLEHVIFVYRQRGRWGSIARSRDPGLHGRKPVFATPRALAKSYGDPYIDQTGCVTAFAVVDLDRELESYDWRLSERNMWKAEQVLIDFPHHPLPINKSRVKTLRARYKAFSLAYPDRKPLRYVGRETWTPLPREFTRPGYDVDWV
jgi:hypothetical protein